MLPRPLSTGFVLLVSIALADCETGYQPQSFTVGYC
jgi:hypothetical protein